MLLRVDIQVPADKIESVLDAVQMDASDELINSLETALRSIKNKKIKN